jgi:flagellar motor switch protein FliN/FliY
MSDDFDDLIAGAGGDGEFADEWAAALAEQKAAKQAAQAPPEPPPPPKPAPSEEARREDINMEVLLDVPVTIALELGRTKMSIRNLLQLTQGSVVELDRLAGEPMDVLVNGTLIAHGEVVVVNDKFGIRLTDVISPTERVKKLR